MTVVSSKEFATNQDKYLELALRERVFIKKGIHTFFVTNIDEDEDESESEYDYEDLMDAKACENDETISGTEFIKYFTSCAGILQFIPFPFFRLLSV